MKWSFIRVVFHWGGLSSGWSFIRMVFHQGSLLPGQSHLGVPLSCPNLFIFTSRNLGHCQRDLWKPAAPNRVSLPSLKRFQFSWTFYRSFPLPSALQLCALATCRASLVGVLCCFLYGFCVAACFFCGFVCVCVFSLCVCVRLCACVCICVCVCGFCFYLAEGLDTKSTWLRLSRRGRRVVPGTRNQTFSPKV